MYYTLRTSTTNIWILNLYPFCHTVNDSHLRPIKKGDDEGEKADVERLEIHGDSETVTTGVETSHDNVIDDIIGNALTLASESEQNNIVEGLDNAKWFSLHDLLFLLTVIYNNNNMWFCFCFSTFI